MTLQDAIARAIAQMDAAHLATLLPDEQVCCGLSKVDFLLKMEDTFRRFQRSGYSPLTTHTGACAHEGFGNKRCRGFAFAAPSGAHFDLIFDEKIAGIPEIEECRGFKTDEDVSMLSIAFNLDITKDERNDFEPPFEGFDTASHLCKEAIDGYLVLNQAGIADSDTCFEWLDNYFPLYRYVQGLANYKYIDDFRELYCLLDSFLTIRSNAHDAHHALQSFNFVFDDIRSIGAWIHENEVYKVLYEAETEMARASESQFTDYFTDEIIPRKEESEVVSRFTTLFRGKYDRVLKAYNIDSVSELPYDDFFR